MKTLKGLFLALIIIISFNTIQAQTAATATWSLTANGNAAVTGQITASTLAKGAALGTFSYNATSGVSTPNWSDDAGSLVTDEYYEYKVTPASGKNFTLTSITGEHSRSNGDWITAIYYSVDNFATSTQIGANFSINSSTSTAFSQNSLSITVNNGGTLSIRIYAWESDNNDRQYRNKSIVLTGTTSDCQSATITTQPSISTQTTCLNKAASSLSVVGSGSGLTYQWYKSTTNSNASGTAVSGASSSSYAPTETAAGTYYYYCQVTAACGAAVKSNVSGAVTVTNVSTPTPTFSTSPGIATTANTNVTYTTQVATTYYWNIPGVSGTDYTIVSGSTSSNSITLKWLSGGAKKVTVNYESTTGCQGDVAAVAETFVPETLSAGAFIINMGSATQTVANAVLPYGLIYDLIRNHSVPVRWVISQTKVKDGNDFVHEGVNYRGGAFIIDAASRTTAVNAKITSWLARGVVGSTTTTSLTIPYALMLTSYPTWSVDNSTRSSIPIAYLASAGINLTDFANAYNLKTPATLGACDDLFVMPHADPTWANHGNLLNWNQQYLGSIWAACHAVSALENMVNPADKTQQTNFLSQKDPSVSLTTLVSPGYANSNSLLLWGSHDVGTAPYTHRLPNDPVAQYIGVTDAAQDNGSERIYVPKQTGGISRWNAGVNMIAYDPSQANVSSVLPDLRNAAAAIVYGRAFDDANRGWVMYESGHDHNGTAADNVAAMRAFFNYSFFVAKDKTPSISTSSATSNRRWIENSNTNSFDVTAFSPCGASFTYQWSSNAGGTFSSPNGATTLFTVPDVEENTPATITCSITDGCGRVSFISYSGLFLYQAPLPVSLTRFDLKKTPKQKVALSWTTASESTNKGFRIERFVEKTNGKFEPIGFVESKAKGGNSLIQLNYAFTDEMPLVGELLQYRLAQIDFDGKTTYGPIRAIRLDEGAAVSIYPNPSKGVFTISKTNDGRKLDVQLIDQFGKVIQSYKAVTSSTLSISLPMSGVYHIKMTYPETGEQTVQRVVVQR